MFAKYMKSLSQRECPVVLSITNTTFEAKSETVIHRNAFRDERERGASDIYMRARQIYFRARRQRPVRAASIF
jgi:hypothetical protein